MYLMTIDPAQACFLLFLIEEQMARHLVRIDEDRFPDPFSFAPPVEGADSGYGNMHSIIEIIEQLDARHHSTLNLLRAATKHVCDYIDEESSESSLSYDDFFDGGEPAFFSSSSSSSLTSSSSLSSQSQTSLSSTSSLDTSSYIEGWVDYIV